MRKNLVFVFLIALFATASAGVRTVYTINDRWKFCPGSPFDAQNIGADDSSWETVNIPHTWNNLDGDDEIPGYYRGPAWYRKSIFVDESRENQSAVIVFEGANQVVELYVNGLYVGKHIGGYTRFNFDISRFLNYGKKNVFAIKVDNGYDPNIPPLSADFTFYGGIYRDVYLMFVDKVHLATNDYASSGVYIRTPEVTEKKAVVEITSLVSNDTDSLVEIILENKICDATGKEVKSLRTNLKIASRTTETGIQKKIIIDNPLLWDIDNPHRYQVYTRVYDKKGDVLYDEVSNPFGLRWFEFDPERGFFLNGKPRKLVGNNRHQDYLAKGNALRDEMHVRDILLMKQMGSNFLRVSHYPQDPVIMEMCDKLGIVTSVEIPVVNAVTDTPEFLENSVNMVKEMIRQDFNRPSVMIWGYMNEILLRRPRTDEDFLKSYYPVVEKTARMLENTIRKEDPSRYTMMAYHNAPDLYERAHLTEIPMIMGWNLYQGWYEPDIDEFQRLLDRAHDKYKGKVLLVTEYGPGVDPRLHSYKPERFDFSQEYGIIYHRHYLREMMARPFIAGFTMWNLNDFYSESRIDAVPHVNNKGVTGLDRERKDTYLFYEASLGNKDVLRIGNREWKNRGGVVNTVENTCVQSVPVFSDYPVVELYVNGKSIGSKKCEENIAFFDVPFVNGENVVEAVARKNGKELRDMIRIDFKLIPDDLKNGDVPFTEMNVMLGSPRYFEDRTAEMIWIPEQPYKPGSWGYIGGEPYRRKTGFGSMLGSDIDIFGTDNNPIFQTQRTGLEAFKADVPDGEYSVYLYWAELDTDKKKESLVYNLGADTENGGYSKRTFGLEINGNPVMDKVDIAEDYGFGCAVIQKFIVNVNDGKGLTVGFKRIEGEPILNAIRIYKNY